MSTVSSLPGGKVFRIAEQVDDLVHGTGEGLHSAASSIRQSGQQGSRTIEDLSESTATKLDSAGSYIEEHDLKHAMDESRRLVGRYPVQALALAAGVGFLTGLAIRHVTRLAPGLWRAPRTESLDNEEHHSEGGRDGHFLACGAL